jgi:hypothetical protein
MQSYLVLEQTVYFVTTGLQRAIDVSEVGGTFPNKHDTSHIILRYKERHEHNRLARNRFRSGEYRARNLMI